MSRPLRLAMIFSLAFHAAVAAYFLVWKKVRMGAPKKGVIAVEFIQPVAHTTHAEAKPRHQELTKAPTPPQNPPPASTAAPTTGQQGVVGDPNALVRESDLYIQSVSQLINARKIYPRAAVDHEEEGRVVIGISIAENGQIVSSKIEEPATFDSLNQAALATIAAVGHFPPLPTGVTAPLHLHVPLVFKIE